MFTKIYSATQTHDFTVHVSSAGTSRSLGWNFERAMT